MGQRSSMTLLLSTVLTALFVHGEQPLFLRASELVPVGYDTQLNEMFDPLVHNSIPAYADDGRQRIFPPEFGYPTANPPRSPQDAAHSPRLEAKVGELLPSEDEEENFLFGQYPDSSGPLAKKIDVQVVSGPPWIAPSESDVGTLPHQRTGGGNRGKNSAAEQLAYHIVNPIQQSIARALNLRQSPGEGVAQTVSALSNMATGNFVNSANLINNANHRLIDRWVDVSEVADKNTRNVLFNELDVIRKVLDANYRLVMGWSDVNGRLVTRSGDAVTKMAEQLLEVSKANAEVPEIILSTITGW